MGISETFNTAIKSLMSNKVRSILTVLGVVIGVFAVVTLVALGKGVQNYITDQFNELGSNLLFVSPGNNGVGGDPGRALTSNKLDEKHLRIIETELNDEIELISPYYILSETAKFKTKQYLTDVVGLSSDGNKMFNYELSAGRYFTKAEEKNDERVVVLGFNVSKQLFGNQNALGQRVDLSGDKYEVIGIVKSKGSNFDDQIILPYTSMKKTFDLTNFSSIAVKVSENNDPNVVLKKIDLVLLSDLDDEDYQVLSQADILSSIQDILGMLTIALSAIAGISLLVGGIGIMNIMLVSVTERTREIGLRKAIGATPKSIAFQFLVESIMLSLVGGLIGLLFGIGATAFAQRFLRAEITLDAVLAALIFSMATGVLFGTYPAVNAAKKNPIEALRYE